MMTAPTEPLGITARDVTGTVTSASIKHTAPTLEIPGMVIFRANISPPPLRD